MKLHGVDVLSFEYGHKFRSVHAGREGVSGSVGGYRVRMRKVKVRLGRDPLEQSRSAGEVQLIPAHVWQFHGSWKRLDSSREDLQTVKLRCFVAGIIESLQSQANSEKGHTTVESFQKRRTQTAFVERANQRGKVSDAWKNQCLGAPETFRSGRSL